MVALLPKHDIVDITESQLIVVLQPGECDFALADASYNWIPGNSFLEKPPCSVPYVSFHVDGDTQLIEALKVAALDEDVCAGPKNVAKEDETTGQAEHEITKELDEFVDDYVVSAIREDEELTSADGEYEWVLHPTPDSW